MRNQTVHLRTLHSNLYITQPGLTNKSIKSPIFLKLNNKHASSLSNLQLREIPDRDERILLYYDNRKIRRDCECDPQIQDSE